MCLNFIFTLTEKCECMPTILQLYLMSLFFAASIYYIRSGFYTSRCHQGPKPHSLHPDLGGLAQAWCTRNRKNCIIQCILIKGSNFKNVAAKHACRETFFTYFTENRREPAFWESVEGSRCLNNTPNCHSHLRQRRLCPMRRLPQKTKDI